MAKWNHYYLIRIEFLGFRYHGWQKQEKLPSVQGNIDKTLLFVLQHDNFKTLGCGRTDAKVSAEDFAFELFVNENQEPQELLTKLNDNLPADIRVKSIETTDASFNIIKDSKVKEYHYTFSFGEKSHPYNTPFIRDLGQHLDIDLIQKAAKHFEGKHDFKRYCAKSSEKDSYECDILFSEIQPDTKFTGSFTPKNTYVFKVKAKGFMRYQVRLMMGALIELGRGEYDFEEFENSLNETDKLPIKTIAPSSALTLVSVEFNNLST
jgi:tRNA pseudouridine38-40 synthase